jgi:hypothetical protein
MAYEHTKREDQIYWRVKKVLGYKLKTQNFKF